MFFDTGVTPPSAELYDAPHWYACLTRSRHEKKVEARLREQGIENFLPVMSRESQWKDRRKHVLFPLFPGYVFGCFTLHSLPRVLSIPGVAAVVGTSGRPAPIPGGEIEAVHRIVALHRAGEAVAGPVPLTEGDPVRIMDGPFQGIEGVVSKHSGRHRVVVGIRAVGQGLQVDVPLSHLMPIASPEAGSRLAAS